MRRIASGLSFLIVLVLLAALPATTAQAAPSQAQWTIMVYISGDNNLEPYVVSDIETELAPTGSSAQVQVVALADRTPGYDTSRGDWQTTKLYHVTKGMLADAASAVADWGERDMGDPKTLTDFVTWSKAHYPAAHYALYFWGHGWNWHPGVVMRDETVPGSALPDTLDYEEEKAAIPSLGFLDVVGYDGCNMASIEIFNLWHGHATAVTSSQEYVGAEGIQYDLVLAQLAANPDMTADQVAVASARSASQDKTWSAVAVDSRFNGLLNAVNSWSLALRQGLPKYRKQYDQAFTATRSFWQAPMDKDLYDMAYQIQSSVPDANLRSRSQAVMNAVHAAVLYERHVNAYASVRGITIYHISQARSKNVLYRYYRSTVDFALQTGWDEFLDAYAIK